MSKRKGAAKAPVIKLAQVPAVPPQLRLEEISMPPASDRWSRAMSFGGIGVDELASILRGSEVGPQVRVQDLYDYMLETDPHLASVSLTRVLGVVSLKHGIVPGKVAAGSPLEPMAKTAADFAQRAIDGIARFSRSLKELDSDGVLKGYGVQETMFERRDGAWLPSELRWRHPRRFIIGKEWQPRLYDNGIHGPDGCELPLSKYVVHIPKERPGYPTRSGVLRAAAWDWIFKKWSIKFMLSAEERFGTPTPFGYVGENTTPTVREALRRGLESLSAGQAAVIVGDTKIDSLNAGAANPQLFQDAINHFDANMSKLVLGSTLNVEGGANGNRAAAESQAGTTIDPRIAADAGELEDTINECLIKPIIEFNLHLFGGVMPPMPRFEFTLAEEVESPLPPAVFVDGLFSVNEIRASYGKDPLPGAEGERRVNISAAPAQPFGGFSASPAPDAVGADAVAPLAMGRTSPAMSSQTSATSVPFATTLLARALSKR